MERRGSVQRVAVVAIGATDNANRSGEDRRHTRVARTGAGHEGTAPAGVAAAAILPSSGIRTDPIGFHLWVTLPQPWT